MALEELNDVQRYLVEEELENLRQRRIGKREFLRRTALLLGAGAASALVLSAGCGDDETTPAPEEENNAGGTASVGEDDPTVRASSVEIPHASGGFTLTGYLATPATVAPGSAALLVIHENRALTPYIQDVVRRWAKAGHVALGVDLLSRLGGTPAFPDESTRPAALGMITPEQTVADLSAGLDLLKARSDVDGARLGVTGFCYGGGYTWRMATQRPDLRAAVAFYGPNPPLEDVPKISAAVLGIYGALDTRITDQVPALEGALMAAGVTYELEIYEGAEHAFHNDTGTRYNDVAAKAAWRRAADWFEEYL